MQIQEQKLKIQLCDYGCGQPGKFKFKNGKWCCSESTAKCPISRKRVSKFMKGENHPLYNKHPSKETRKKQSESHIGKKYPPKTEKYKKN